jgi:spore maturation protein CgeB
VPRKFSIALFLHSIRSDWNNGHAHFMRGLVRALVQMGHTVTCFERESDWSIDNLRDEGEAGHKSLLQFETVYPEIRVAFHNADRDALRAALQRTEIVVVHEWNPPELIDVLLKLRDEIGFQILLHDTHHRASSSPEAIDNLRVARFDGVLAFGQALKQIYRSRFGLERVWVLHEGADTSVFHPRNDPKTMDVLWVGNWGDEERSREICEYLVHPAASLPQFSFMVHGVRYPAHGLEALRNAHIRFGGYLANLDAAKKYAEARLTFHIPRQQYSTAMTGIPTIRIFEALASGIPLISAPWSDSEALFRPGDFRMVANGAEMITAIRQLLKDPVRASEQAAQGLRTVLARHTCRHRAEEFTSICEELTT